jgi:sugar O-acyltransferase (sialic acid O-acetyltransferase NeuD family)
MREVAVTDLVFVGTGGQARELHALNDALGGDWEPVGFLDDDPDKEGEQIHGLPVLGGVDWLASHHHVAVAVGAAMTPARRHLVERIRAFGPRQFPTLVHPSSTVGAPVELGSGVFVCPGAVLTTDIKIGDHVLLNSGCILGHDTVIESFVTVGPGTHISGSVYLGEGADIGAGTSIIQGVNIGEWSIVGAGAVVIDHVPPNTTVVGVPGNVIKQRHPGWYLDIG